MMMTFCRSLQLYHGEIFTSPLLYSLNSCLLGLPKLSAMPLNCENPSSICWFSQMLPPTTTPPRPAMAWKLSQSNNLGQLYSWILSPQLTKGIILFKIPESSNFISHYFPKYSHYFGGNFCWEVKVVFKLNQS